MLEEKQKRAANKLTHELSLSTDNNKILDINNNILFTRDNNSDSSTDCSNKKNDTAAKPSTPVLTIPISSSKHISNPSSTNTATKKNIVPNHSTSTPQNTTHTSKSVITTTSNSTDKKNETPITKEREPKPKITSQNNEKKTKRKRNSETKNEEYVEEFSGDSSDDQYSDADIDADVRTKIRKEKKLDDDKLVSESDAHDDNAEVNDLAPTATDAGAFTSSSEPVNNNN
jgi:hypothetical protein